MDGEKSVPEFIEDLPRRNRASYSVFRIIVRYSLIFALSFVAGILVSYSGLLPLPQNSTAAEDITNCFKNVFAGCKSCKDYFTVMISASAPDIRYLIFTFAAGFTYFCSVATSAFIICRGFTVGFSLWYLIVAAKTGGIALSQPSYAAVIFAVTELVLAGVMIWLSTKSLMFGYDFRRLRGRKSLIVRSPIIYLYMLLYLTAFGLILIINTSSCFVSMLIYR